MKPSGYPSAACYDSWVLPITIINEIGNKTCVKNPQKIARPSAMELAIHHQPLTRIDAQKTRSYVIVSPHSAFNKPCSRHPQNLFEVFDHVLVVIQSLADASRIEFETQQSPLNITQPVGHGIATSVVLARCEMIPAAMEADPPAVFDQSTDGGQFQLRKCTRPRRRQISQSFGRDRHQQFIVFAIA